MAFLFWLWCYIITKGDQCTNWYTTLYTIDSSSNFHCLLFATRNVQSFTFVHLPQNTLLCVCVGRLISLSEDAITIVSFDQVELTDPYQPGLWQPTCYWVCLFGEDTLQLLSFWNISFEVFPNLHPIDFQWFLYIDWNMDSCFSICPNQRVYDLLKLMHAFLILIVH